MTKQKKIGKAAIVMGAGILMNELRKISIEASEKIIKNSAKEAGDKVVEKAKEAFSDSKETKDQYKALKKVIISKDADVETFKDAISEASNMQNYYQYELDSINPKNPVNIPKNKLAKNQHKKWGDLLTSLRAEAHQRILKEATVVYESKNETIFFEPYPVINADLINCESISEFDEILLRIKKYYLKDFSIGRGIL